MDQSQIASSGENRPSKELFPRSDTDISQLPPEILAKIFQKLSVQDKGRVAQVCNAWCDVAYMHSLWRHLEAKISLNEKVNPFLIPTLANRGVRKVKVTNLSGHCLRYLMDGVPNLTSLNLRWCKQLNDTTLFSAFSKKRSLLNSLNMDGCRNFTDTSITLLAMKLKNLNILSLQECPQLTDMSLLLIARGLLNLKQLSLNNSALITNKGIANLSGFDTHKADSYCQLEYLSLSNYNLLTDQALKHLSEGQGNLQSLSLQHCKNITDNCMMFVSELAKLKLVFLNGSNFGDDKLFQLSAGKPLISQLVLGNCNLSDLELGTIGKMTHLWFLKLISCSGITHVGLKNLADQGSRISTLILSSYPGITNDGLTYIAKLQYLKKLELKSANIDILGLLNLAEGESNITNLNLTGCNLIDAQTLRITSSVLFSLRILTLDNNHVDDAGMDLAARTLTKLTSLIRGGTELIGEIVKIRKRGSS